MPPQKIYGKRNPKNKTLCSTISTFNRSSSPLRRSPRKHGNETAGQMEGMIEGFGKLEIVADKKRVERRDESAVLREKKDQKEKAPHRQEKEEEAVWAVDDSEAEPSTTGSAGSSSEGAEEDSVLEVGEKSDSGSDVVSSRRTRKTTRRDHNSSLETNKLKTPIKSRRKIKPPTVIDSSDSELDSSSITSSPEVLYAQPLLSLCNDGSSRRAPIAFDLWSSALEEKFQITKIAEASYGEVYRISQLTPSQIARSEESVFKLIPLKPCPALLPPREIHHAGCRKRENYSAQKEEEEEEEDDYAWKSTVESVASEVQLLKHMASTPGFTNFRDIKVVRGRPSKTFCAAWKSYNKAQPRDKKSQFPDPSKKDSYADTQLWAVIEMQDAGSDLEHVVIDHIWGLWDIFWNLVLTLAKGEEFAHFEHRDLHLGNICVRSRDSSEFSAKPRTHAGKLGFTNLETTIIDYTLSRANLAEDNVACLDLDSDPAVFEGDGAEHYQYDLYRYMRASFFGDDPLSQTHNHPENSPKPKKRGKKQQRRSWRDYNPRTNVVWLHFVLHMLLMQLPAERRELEKADRSAKKAKQLERRLRRLNQVLDVKREDRTEEEDFASARELVEWAVIAGWLNESDVLGSVSDEAH